MKIPSKRDRDIYNLVMNENASIRAAAAAYAVSPSTVRRILDKVTEWKHSQHALTLTGDELDQVIGWLRNGNTTAGLLADKIVEVIES